MAKDYATTVVSQWIEIDKALDVAHLRVGVRIGVLARGRGALLAEALLSFGDRGVRNMEDYRLLAHIARTHPVSTSATEASAVLGISKAATAVRLERFGHEGLVERGVRRFDKRTIEVIGTPAGHQLALECTHAIAEAYKGILDPLTTKELKTLETLVQKLGGNISRWLEGEKAHAESDPFMRVVASWLDANRPPEAPLTLVHGDLQAPNIMIQEGTGEFYLLDWELSRIGDPREDLGWWALAGKSQPPDLIEVSPDDFYASYREKTGFSEEIVNPATVAYFTVLGSFAVFNAVIEQTASMARGQSSATSVAYMTNAVPFMHSVFVDSMRKAGAWREEAQ